MAGGGRTEASRARKRERTLARTHQVLPGPSIMEQIFADLDRAVGVWVSLKDEGYGPGDVRVSRAYGEVVGIARGIGRFGWIEGVSSYRPNAGMKAAIRASLARVREVGESG